MQTLIINGNNAQDILRLKAARFNCLKDYQRTGDGTYKDMADTLGAIIDELQTAPAKKENVITEIVESLVKSARVMQNPKSLKDAIEIGILDGYLADNFNIRIINRPVPEKYVKTVKKGYINPKLQRAALEFIRDNYGVDTLLKGTKKEDLIQILSSEFPNNQEELVILVTDYLPKE